MLEERDVYVKIAQETGVFNPQAIEVMKEVIDNYVRNPDKDYWLIEEKCDNKVVGFVIFGRTPITDFTWDIYWLVVNKDFQRKGIGKILFKRVQEHILQRDKRAVLRVETSAEKDFDQARKFYIREGFEESGRIVDFYSEGNDLVTYYKEIKIS
jgi:ribosomal protein S18 acetylase RimI-like enzyme